MKFLKLLIPLLFAASIAAGQSWSTSPAVTTQTRIVAGSGQIRWLWGSTGIVNFHDTLRLNYIGTIHNQNSSAQTANYWISGTGIIQKDNIGIGITPGLIFQNTTSATNVLNQNSPGFSFIGYGWNPLNLASNAVRFNGYVQPITANSPQGNFIIDANASPLYFFSSGGTLSSAQGFKALSGNIIQAGIVDAGSVGANGSFTGNIGQTANGQTLAGIYSFPTFNSGGVLQTVGTIVGGSGGTNGTYPGIILVGTNQKNVYAAATFVVSGGSVTSVTVTSGGNRYTVGETITVPASQIGNTTGFSCQVASISNYTGGLNYSGAFGNAPVLMPVGTSSYGSFIIPAGALYTGSTPGHWSFDGSDVWFNIGGTNTKISNQVSGGGSAVGGELSGTLPNPTLVNSAVIGKVLTGYTSGAGTVSATDNILQAFQKVNGNVVNNTANIATNTASILTKENALLLTAPKTANYTLSVNDYAIGDATAGVFTFTLPNAPADGSIVGVKMVGQTGTNSITLAVQGVDVFNGGGTSGVLSLNYQAAVFKYKLFTHTWVATSTALPLSLLDTRYAATGGGVLRYTHTMGYGLSGGNFNNSGNITSIVDTTVVKSKSGFNTDYTNLSGRITTNTTNIATNTTNIATLQNRNINTGYGLTGGGNLTADRTHIVDTTVIKSKVGAAADYTVLANRIRTKVAVVANYTALQAFSDSAKVVINTDAATGGVFRYSALETADGGVVLSATGIGTGYWVRQFNKADGVNPEWWGVVADGVTNNYVNMQKPFNYVNSTGGGKVAFPYRSLSYNLGALADTTTGKAIQVYSNTIIDLNGSTITQKDSTSGGFDCFYPANNITIKNGTMIGRGDYHNVQSFRTWAHYPAPILFAYNNLYTYDSTKVSSNIHIEKMVFKNWAYGGPYLQNVKDVWLNDGKETGAGAKLANGNNFNMGFWVALNTSNINIDHFDADSNATGGFMEFSKNSHISNCNLTNNIGQHGLYVGNLTSCKIDHNTIINTWFDGIKVQDATSGGEVSNYGTTNLIVDNNTIINYGDHAINCYRQSGGSRMVNNHFNNNHGINTAGTSGPGDGLHILNQYNGEANNNSFKGGRYNYYFSSDSLFKASENYGLNAAQSGAVLNATQDFDFVNNKIVNPSRTINNWGIDVTGTTNNLQLFGNRVKDTVDANMQYSLLLETGTGNQGNFKILNNQFLSSNVKFDATQAIGEWNRNRVVGYFNQPTATIYGGFNTSESTITGVTVTVPSIFNTPTNTFSNTVAGGNVETVPLTLANQTANAVLGNFTGSSATPTWGKVAVAQADTSLTSTGLATQNSLKPYQTKAGALAAYLLVSGGAQTVVSTANTAVSFNSSASAANVGIAVKTTDPTNGTIVKLSSVVTNGIKEGQLSYTNQFSFIAGGKTALTLDPNNNLLIGNFTTAATGILQAGLGTAGVGTISTTATLTTVTGVGTQFQNDFSVGQTITANGETRTIATISSQTSMTTDAWTNTNTAIAYTLVGGTRLQVFGRGDVQLNNYTTGIAHLGSTGLITSSTIATTDISANAVTYAKMQAGTATKIYGTGTGTAFAELTALGTQGVSVVFGASSLTYGLGAITPTSSNTLNIAASTYQGVTTGGTTDSLRFANSLKMVDKAVVAGTGISLAQTATTFTISGTNAAHTIFTPTTGQTITLINNQRNIINPSGTLVALTVTLPASPANNDVVFITFTQAVTTITYAGGTVVDGITSPAAGAYKVLTYDSGTTSWY